METRIIKQVKIWILKMNSIYSKAEDYEVVLMSTEKQKIIDYYKENKCDKYKNGVYTKSFKKDSLLESYNPADSENLENGTTFYGEDILTFSWISEESLKIIEVL